MHPERNEASLFRIEATEAVREPRTRTLKHDDTFAVLDSFGTCRPPGARTGSITWIRVFLSRLGCSDGDRPRTQLERRGNNTRSHFDLTQFGFVYADVTVLRRSWSMSIGGIRLERRLLRSCWCALRFGRRPWSRFQLLLLPILWMSSRCAARPGGGAAETLPNGGRRTRWRLRFAASMR